MFDKSLMPYAVFDYSIHDLDIPSNDAPEHGCSAPHWGEACLYKQYRKPADAFYTFSNGASIWIKGAISRQPDKIKLTFIVYGTDESPKPCDQADMFHGKPAIVSLLISCDKRQLSKLWDYVMVLPVPIVLLAHLTGILDMYDRDYASILTSAYTEQMSAYQHTFNKLTVTLDDVYPFI